MEYIQVKDIWAACQAGKLRAYTDGPGIWIEDTETHEAVMLVDRQTPAAPGQRKSRVERMFGSRESWGAPAADEGQGPYKGFLLVVCEECGEVKAFCAKRETYGFRCGHCGHETPLEHLRPMYMHCKCGKSFRYKTNANTETITHACLDCKAPVDMELNTKGTAYVTIGVRKGQV